MRRFRRQVARFRRAKRELLWVRSEGTIGALAGSGQYDEAIVVTGADWSRGSTTDRGVQKGCVLLRSIVTWTAYMPPNAAPASEVEGDAGFIGLRRVDEDDLTALHSGTDLFTEDWMHLEWWEIDRQTHNVATLTYADRTHARWTRSWDSKVKRKLTTEDQIRFGAARSAFLPTSFTENGTFYVDFFSQFLLQLP